MIIPIQKISISFMNYWKISKIIAVIHKGGPDVFSQYYCTYIQCRNIYR